MNYFSESIAQAHVLSERGDHWHANRIREDVRRVLDTLYAHSDGDMRLLFDIGKKYCALGSGGDIARGYRIAAEATIEAGQHVLGDLLCDSVYVDAGASDKVLELYDLAFEQGRWPTPNVRGAKEELAEQGLPFVLVNTLPKSGSMFILGTLRRTLQIPYVRVSIPGKSVAGIDHRIMGKTLGYAVQGGCISQAHLEPSAENLRAFAKAGLRRFVVHIRDPREAVYSRIRHIESFLPEEYFLRKLAGDKALYFPELAMAEKKECVIEAFYHWAVDWIEGWVEVVESNSSFDILMTEYGDLANDDASFIAMILEYYGFDRERYAVCLAAKDRAHNFRKGSRTEWRENFTQAQQDEMWRLMPKGVARRFGWTR